MERIVRISWLVVVWVDLVGHGTDWFGLVGTGSDWFGLAGRAWTLPSPLSLFLSLSLSLLLARSLFSKTVCSCVLLQTFIELSYLRSLKLW